MDGKTQTLNEEAAVLIYGELDKLSSRIESLKQRLLRILPPKYGSDLWWEKSDQKAIKEIKAGKGIAIKNEKGLKRFLQL